MDIDRCKSIAILGLHELNRGSRAVDAATAWFRTHSIRLLLLLLRSLYWEWVCLTYSPVVGRRPRGDRIPCKERSWRRPHCIPLACPLRRPAPFSSCISLTVCTVKAPPAGRASTSVPAPPVIRCCSASPWSTPTTG